MSPPAPVIVWFRRDLRLLDNPALSAAVASGRPVVPIYIHEDRPAGRALGSASLWWLNRSLGSLSADLAEIGASLVLRRGDSADVIQMLLTETGAAAVYWNRLYDPASTARDAAIKARLRQKGVECRSFSGALLNEPWAVQTGSGRPYHVFTPYWRAARLAVNLGAGNPAPVRLTPPPMALNSDSLPTWALHPANPDWSTGFSDWEPGEAGAQVRLQSFFEGPAARAYSEGRDRPGQEGTSRLSPHLHFGEISPRQVWTATSAALERGDMPDRDAETFLKELGWRDFNAHLLFHRPDIDTAPFNARFRSFPWRHDDTAVRAWRTGATGYPLVDAGMRQLWQTGWMHNRVRMVAASFLVKDLMIDWQVGEAWFWETLVDADPASNAGNWQWVAGSGADAAPYFRIFNPTRQAETFDPGGAYIRRWAPELQALPNDVIHAPWRASASALAQAGIKLGSNYPYPIVDHAAARNRALNAYRNL